MRGHRRHQPRCGLSRAAEGAASTPEGLVGGTTHTSLFSQRQTAASDASSAVVEEEGDSEGARASVITALVAIASDSSAAAAFSDGGGSLPARAGARGYARRPMASAPPQQLADAESTLFARMGPLSAADAPLMAKLAFAAAVGSR